MESDILQLTEEQKMALSLRKQGLTYAAVGEKMGISASNASHHCKLTERKIREYEYYQKKELFNDTPVKLTLTRGQIKIIVAALRMFAISQELKGQRNIRTDIRSNLSFEHDVIVGLVQQLSETLADEKGK